LIPKWLHFKDEARKDGSMRKQLFSVLLIALLPGLLSACVTHAETVAEHFDRQMKAFAKDCAKTTPRPGSTSCDRLKLKPADPLATEEGRFAHSIKIPNPVSEDSGYKPGMTSEQYFDHLCKTEAGEFIYKTVENVEGLYMMRSRKEASDYELEHLYALEDPYGHENWEATHPARIFVRLKTYTFFEGPLDGADSHYVRYSGFDDRDPKSMKEEKVGTLRSRFGYTWRGITRPHDRELGIAGGELIILDLQSKEVLAVRRAYIRSGDVRNNLTGIWWMGGHVCSANSTRLYRTYEFVARVVKPGHGLGKEVSDAAK
jgi:hypothetical protein